MNTHSERNPRLRRRGKRANKNMFLPLGSKNPRPSRARFFKVYIPSPLRSYTLKSEVEAGGRTLGDLLSDLDRRYPGLRFRIINEQDGIREHIKIFINQEQTHDLAAPVRSDDVVQILCALSGG